MTYIYMVSYIYIPYMVSYVQLIQLIQLIQICLCLNGAPCELHQVEEGEPQGDLRYLGGVSVAVRKNVQFLRHNETGVCTYVWRHGA